MYVYLITNLVNGKIYVGKTVNKNLHDYFSVKRWAVRHNKNNGMRLIRALRKYGMDNFVYEVVDTAESNEELCYLEQEWIKFLESTNPKAGYNVTTGGEGGRRPCSEETKRKIGLANKGRKPKVYIRTAKHREQLQQRMTGNQIGKKITPEISAQWHKSETPEQKLIRGAAIKAAWDRRKLAEAR